MKTVSLSGSSRANVGKKDAKKLRKEGKVPCVIYGGKEQKHFYLDQKDFKKIIFTPEVFIIKIDLEGTTYETILQDIQYHPVSDFVLHADFLELTPGRAVTLAIPVQLEGTAPGVVKGGRLQLKLRKLRLKGKVEDMPEHVVLDISGLDIGKSIKVKDVPVENVQFLDPANAVVVSVKAARGISAAELEAEGEEAEESEEAEG
ncbi:50S ribosomal protein L25/general stress protein Ctc [Candidatus Sulfidibacterium hydrothermale]|uniref:50S ribosomal protein L25/general stress protein Ctc n=1 Tax=Candidatus Sulfidibacterium hydrothermale TaxID=2875962 RepID=UPI001F0A1A91|nr:50S ribosomal protein L25/general stress protein Ctc [Candidatus Sulfidibacterium hydrothermale]UBM62362.1 50S ribosomal protein L25/general stress protein Ctc [Candidatus Sulfidibacterium hydrothermale]